jgi:hypothetical protein
LQQKKAKLEQQLREWNEKIEEEKAQEIRKNQGSGKKDKSKKKVQIVS